MVQVTDQAGVTRWGSVREATFAHDAMRTGDWEGTAEQEQHRHGGGNVGGAPTSTDATGATSLGEYVERQEMECNEEFMLFGVRQKRPLYHNPRHTFRVFNIDRGAAVNEISYSAYA